ncbi:MAG TPA: hypothetical protein PKX05_00470, partial [bacterium]|nr:hypothetical protein [bacterium]
MELLRIIDANFNRVREGLRVIEDILRFSSSGNNFQAQLREIRHLFTFSYIKYFGSIPITKRNILEDIGKNNPPYRAKTSKEIVLRNFLRIEEGIRSIEECSAVVCPQSTHIWQELRFKIYAIEKRVQSILPEKEIPAFFIGIMLSGFDIKRLATVIEIVIKAK